MQEPKQKQPNPYQNAIKKEQDEIVLSYMPALKTMAFRLKERLPANIEVSELISIGVEEMIKLSRKYDKTQNNSFWGYARKRVYGSMLDYLRSLDLVSRSNRKLIRQINKAVDEYFNKFEEEPDDEYLAKVLNEDIEKIKNARNANMVSSVLSLDEQIGTLSSENTEETVSRDDLIQKIENVLNNFTQREQLIIQLYYYEELSLKEISEILEISEGRISQIHKRLLTKIRENLEG
ncbi:RNA polymerase sigma28 factor [Campylobacter pinnipediorum subsp. caledonicus]|uniref:RNA polymerase sigma28 factor n=1 Tax=Campylobacter pinnipediorum subsp. caledonicus TaxID=1874362 RepID=A0A1S6U8B1_9BACT|nr:RNA polymerase sigma factor FliA [Campylobacter pinnipediorum]AQW86338.1 RNA polymerase sigma28 factor [Campylobacter pinnipediorum subsp. caledonicus]AQW87991.1 RNA polymerase sigma28 factor [Campylobacter pinnipediorum subsp. caledonicus]OPA71436.1 RNA polymerase sigma factor FliA [Campylobacter pinnipediorum subsp. caledonicus]